MASYGYTFQSGDGVTPTRLNDARTVGDIVNADISATAGIVGTKIANDTIVNANINSSAAIAGTKIAPDFGSQNVVTTGSFRVGTNLTPVPIEARKGTAAGPNDVLAIGVEHGALGRESRMVFGATFSSGWSGADVNMRYSGGIGYGSTGGESSRDLALKFYTADLGVAEDTPTERMRITSNGRVAIGTTSPVAGIHLVGAGSTSDNPSTSANIGATLALQDSGAASGNGGMVMFGATQGFYAAIKGSAIDGGSNTTGALIFATRRLVGDSTLTESMRVNPSGNVGIGTASPNAAALLDVSSTTKGFLPPRMTTAQRDAISTPPAGLVIYNTSTNVLNFYNGSAWGAV